MYSMLMHGVTSNKSQFLISEMGCLSKDLLILLFTSLNSHDRFMTPLVPFLFAMKDTCKCWKPIWNAILRTFSGYLLRSVIGVGGRGEG